MLPLHHARDRQTCLHRTIIQEHAPLSNLLGDKLRRGHRQLTPCLTMDDCQPDPAGLRSRKRRGAGILFPFPSPCLDASGHGRRRNLFYGTGSGRECGRLAVGPYSCKHVRAWLWTRRRQSMEPWETPANAVFGPDGISGRQRRYPGSSTSGTGSWCASALGEAGSTRELGSSMRWSHSSGIRNPRPPPRRPPSGHALPHIRDASLTFSLTHSCPPTTIRSTAGLCRLLMEAAPTVFLVASHLSPGGCL